MCYHEGNLCDQYPVCDNAKDEDWNKCAGRYNFKKGATFHCQSLHHNEDTVKANLSRGIVWIKAVPQDSIPECWNNADEETNLYFTYGIPGNIKKKISKLPSYNMPYNDSEWFLWEGFSFFVLAAPPPTSIHYFTELFPTYHL